MALVITPDGASIAAFKQEYLGAVVVHGSLSAPFPRFMAMISERLVLGDDRIGLRHKQGGGGSVFPGLNVGDMPGIVPAVAADEVAGYMTNAFYGWATTENTFSELVVSRTSNPRARIQDAIRQAREIGLSVSATNRYNLMYGDGVGPNPSGVFTLFEAQPKASQTGRLGGLDKATYTFMRNEYVALTTNASDILPGANWPHVLVKLDELIEAMTTGQHRPSHALMPKATWKIIEDYLIANYANAAQTVWGSYSDWSLQTQAFKWKGVICFWDETGPQDKILLMHARPNIDTRINHGLGPSWDTLAESPETGMIDPFKSDMGYLTIAELKHANFVSAREFAPITSGFDKITPFVDSWNLDAYSGKVCGILYGSGSRMVS